MSITEFVPNQNQTSIARHDWDNLRPLQRRILLELELTDETLDALHDVIDFVIFRKFDELSPDMQKSVIFMIGGFE